MRNVALPYLTLEDAELIAGPWEYRPSNSEEWLLLGDRIAEWDYAMRFSVRRQVKIEKDAIRRVFGGALAGLKLALTVAVRSGSGRGHVGFELARLEFPVGAPEVTLEAAIPSSILSGRLLLQAQVVTLGDVSHPAALVPARRGCKLWQDEKSVSVSGIGSRLPMELVSFKDQYRQFVRAPWLIHWSQSEWDRDFTSAVVVMINDDAAESREAIMRSDPQLLRLILVDLVSDIVSGYLGTSELPELPNWPEGSLGQVVEAWIAVLSGHDTTRGQLRYWASDSPGMLRARATHVFSSAARAIGEE